MKTPLHVLVPDSITSLGLKENFERLLAAHRIDWDAPEIKGHYDYLCLLHVTLNCAETEAELPHEVRRMFTGRISTVHRLRPDACAAALVTPDGEWHDSSDFGWSMVGNHPDANAAAEREWNAHYRVLLSENPYCWVIETTAHS